MYITTFVLISLIGSFILLLSACVYLYILYRHALRARKPHRDLSETQILERANARAQHIIDQAVTHSQETLYQTEFIKQELVHHGEQTIQQVINHIIELLEKDGVTLDSKYKAVFDEVQKQYTQKTTAAIEQIQLQASAELDAFHKTVTDGAIGSQKMLEAKVEEEFAKSQKEIAAYRDAEYKKIDTQITQMIGKVVAQVIGQVIPMESHEKLIMEAFEQAKAEGMLGNHLVQPESKPVQGEHRETQKKEAV